MACAPTLIRPFPQTLELFNQSSYILLQFYQIRMSDISGNNRDWVFNTWDNIFLISVKSEGGYRIHSTRMTLQETAMHDNFFGG